MSYFCGAGGICGSRGDVQQSQVPSSGRPSTSSTAPTIPPMDPLRSVRDPGPHTLEVLYGQPNHISEDTWKSNGKTELRSYASWHLPDTVPPVVEALLRQAGFFGAFMIGQCICDRKLTLAFVERWRPETHTFHIPQGEITITLQDVEILLGLSIDGDPIIGVYELKKPGDWLEQCKDAFGIAPPGERINSGGLDMTWIKENVINNGVSVDDDWFDGDIERVLQYTRGIIMLLLGGVLLPDKTGTVVKLHYLHFIRDFETCSGYSWGSAVLAYLYRELCSGAYGAKSIGGALMLLQLWAWVRFPFSSPMAALAPLTDASLPLGCRLNRGRRRSLPETVTHHLRFFREQLSNESEEQVEWEPYKMFGIADDRRWRVRAPLIHYYIVEFHYPDRVLRQYGRRQGKPAACDPDDKGLHKMKGSGQRGSKNWSNVHKKYVRLWETRLESSVVEGDLHMGGSTTTTPDYMHWYHKITRRFIIPPLEHGPGFSSQIGPNAIKADTLREAYRQLGHEQPHVSDILKRGMVASFINPEYPSYIPPPPPPELSPPPEPRRCRRERTPQSTDTNLEPPCRSRSHTNPDPPRHSRSHTNLDLPCRSRSHTNPDPPRRSSSHTNPDPPRRSSSHNNSDCISTSRHTNTDLHNSSYHPDEADNLSTSYHPDPNPMEEDDFHMEFNSNFVYSGPSMRFMDLLGDTPIEPAFEGRVGPHLDISDFDLELGLRTPDLHTQQPQGSQEEAGTFSPGGTWTSAGNRRNVLSFY